MSDVLNRITELVQQRANLNGDIDREIEGLKAQALLELDAMRSQLSRFETVLKGTVMHQFGVEKPMFPPVRSKPARTELDETDAGNGIRETQDGVSATDFRDELAMLRERTAEKRRRLG